MKFPKFPNFPKIAIKRHHVHHGGLIIGGLAAAVVFFAIGAALRLLIGPVSLAPFSAQLSESIGKSLPGISVKFDEAALEWSRTDRRVNVVILGARVFDNQNRLVAQAPKAAVDLAAGPFFRGQISVRRITLIGVQLTMVRCTDGVLRLGVEGSRQTSDVLQRLIADISKQNNTATRLQSVAVRDARIAFFGEASGLFVVAPRANLSITNTGKKNNATLEANVDASIDISGHTSQFVAALRLPPGSAPATGTFTLSNFNLRALGENAKPFAALKNVNLTFNLSGKFALTHGTRLRDADLSADANGVVTDARIPGGPLHVKMLRAAVHYDGESGQVLIQNASLISDHADTLLTGNGKVQMNANGVFTRIDADVMAQNLILNIPGFFAAPVNLDHVNLRAGYVPSTGEMDFERVAISGGPLTMDISGKIVFAQNTMPAMDVQGKVDAINVRDMLHYWPLDMAAGARAWIDENMSAGKLGPIAIVTHIPMGALRAPALPDSDVNIAFPIAGASAIYVDGLPPLTDGQGSALLTGNTFTLNLNSARVGGLIVSKGRIAIPDLSQSTPVGDITAHVDGSVPETLALIDKKPLGYPTRFGINPAVTKGSASIDLNFHVPLVRGESIDQIGIGVKAEVKDLEIAIGKTQISGGVATFTVDNNSLHAVGTTTMSGAHLALDWTEKFKAVNGVSTSLAVKGVLDENVRAALGLDTGEFLSGPVGVTANLQGLHGKITRGTVALDLTPAAINVDLIDYSKAAGVPASAQLNVVFAPDGAMSAENLHVAGSGLLVTGTAAFDKNGTVAALDLPTVHAGSLNDFAIHLTRSAAAGLDVSLTGREYDGGKLISHNDRSTANASTKPPSTEPFHISVQLNSFSLRNGVSLAPFALTVSGAGDRPESMSLNTSLPKGQKLTAGMISGEGGRKLTVETSDAGTLIKGLFGFDSMKGGALTASATLAPVATATDPPKGVPDYQGAVTIHDFRIVHQPFLVRLFSAGSLDGLVGLLQDQGIAFDKMDVPFSSKNGVMQITDARAAGMALGVTAEGYIDRNSDKVSVGGTLAPIYGINSILGAIPILGNVLVSKPGEGLIGMTYSVSGSATEPSISVNPFSVLTPGIFRRIFEGTHVPPPPALETNATPTAPVPAPKPGG